MSRAAGATTFDDALLVEGLRRRDDAAFEHLVGRHLPRMLGVARRFLRSEEDARDAVQDAFLSAFRAIDGFQAESSLATWLHRIVVNACLMRLRSKRRIAEEPIDGLLPRYRDDGHQVEPTRPWEESVEEMAARSEVCDLVRQSIGRLPDNYRVVLLMRDIEEMSTEEVAEALGVTANVVKVRLHRARQALRRLIDVRLTEVRR